MASGIQLDKVPKNVGIIQSDAQGENGPSHLTEQPHLARPTDNLDDLQQGQNPEESSHIENPQARVTATPKDVDAQSELSGGTVDASTWHQDEEPDQLLGAQQESPSHDTQDDDNNSTSEQSTVAPDQHEDGFSDMGSETSSIFATVFSEETDFFWENGRRYLAHDDGRYMLPNDETELDREDMKHHEWMLITGFRLHLSPIDRNPQRILDLGTGTGIWAMQIADLYPSAEVIGTDLSPVQPKWVPPNLYFEIDDLEAEWMFPAGSYNLVHVRFMFLAIKDYPAMLAQAYRTLKPGGFVELSELGVTPEATNPNYPQPVVIPYWLGLYDRAMKQLGFNFKIAHSLKAMLIEAGFVDVVETRLEVPWGSWHEDKRLKGIGLWHLEQLMQGLQGIVMGMFTRVLGWTAVEVEVFLVGLRKELVDKNYHLMDYAYVVYGRKPS